MSAVLVDTGPLLALLNAREEHHAWTRNQLADVPAPLLTCEPVLTEAYFLAHRQLGGADPLLKLFDNGVVQLAFAMNDHWPLITALLRRYRNVPMSLADACLVRMSEVIDNCKLITLDSDFRIYRRHGRRVIPLILPDVG